jgi:hypothetical protein
MAEKKKKADPKRFEDRFSWPKSKGVIVKPAPKKKKGHK